MMRAVLAACVVLAVSAPGLRADPDLTVGLAQIRAGEWAAARTAMGRIDDPAAADVVLWHLLRNRQGDFDEAVAFLDRNPDWPGEPLLLSRVESTLPATTPSAGIVAHF